MGVVSVTWSTINSAGNLDPQTLEAATGSPVPVPPPKGKVLPFFNPEMALHLGQALATQNSWATTSFLWFSRGANEVKAAANKRLNHLASASSFPGMPENQLSPRELRFLGNYETLDYATLMETWVIAERAFDDCSVQLRVDGTLFIPVRQGGIILRMYLRDNAVVIRVKPKHVEKLSKLIADGHIHQSTINQAGKCFAEIWRLYSAVVTRVLDTDANV